MTSERRLLITGATGTLGRAFSRVATTRGLPHELTTRQEIPLDDPQSIGSALDEMRPWAVINTAGFVRVDEAESANALCRVGNFTANALLAEACARIDVPFVTFSSDLVFDGERTQPYLESDQPNPLNCYGRCKALAEVSVLHTSEKALVVRTSAFFGPWDDYNFVRVTRRQLEQGLEVTVASDAWISPTYVPDLVNATLDLLIDGETGIWHLANDGALTWEELARRTAGALGASQSLVVGRRTGELGLAARRPLYSVLGSERGWIMPSFDDAFDRYFATLQQSA